MANNKVKTRFAPSPTGSIHVGNARNALFEYLFAKKNGGDFLLRIEDTDQKRYEKEAVEKVFDTLKWLGINWDGDATIQSSRLSLYKDYARDLVEKGHAYFCFCSESRLEELKAEQEKKHLPPGYDRKCRNLSAEEVLEKIKNGEPHVIRLKMPESGKVKFNDLIRGEIEFDYSLVDDQVLLKEDGFPTYHLASVIDDHDQGITHVIRSDEWISSTPKHLYLYNCFGWDAPLFAHPALILGSDKKKLSKREGAVSVEDFKEQGYLPEALINFMVLLGWNPGTEQEYFTLGELEKVFELEKVNKAPSMFDIDKLNHFNAHYIHQMKDDELLERIKPYSKLEFDKFDNSFLQKAVRVVKERMTVLTDFDIYSHFFFNDVNVERDMIKFAKSEWQDTQKGLEKVVEAMPGLKEESFQSPENINGFLTEIVVANNLKNGDVFWPVRASLSGEMSSSSPAELVWVLGKDESLRRLNDALNKIDN